MIFYARSIALPKEKNLRLTKIINDMMGIYSTAKICDFYNRNSCNLTIEPGLIATFASSRNPDELKYLWEQARDKTKVVKDLYKEYVDLLNQAAYLNNFTNAAEMYLEVFEDPLFQEQLEDLLEQIQPFYLQLHAYVRRKLRNFYGASLISADGPIPAHLLGNLMSQDWTRIYDITLPYNNRSTSDVSKILRDKKYSVLDLVKMAENFFTSINLPKMTKKFWKNSIFEKSETKEMVCHPTAYDMYDENDFRIMMCGSVDENTFYSVHHEMGHIQYFMAYKDQPTIFRDAANPGFHEAVGDLISLSVRSHKHLTRLNLTKIHNYNYEDVINDLYKLALEKVVFLPFSYVMDRWRWDVFAGKISFNDYNSKWWELREKYQGIEPPLDRSMNDFDPAVKFHIVANSPFIPYFISYIIQFQFHRALCEAAGEYDYTDPEKRLFKCDIYGKHEAGNILEYMLRAGASQPWPEAMKSITGQRYMEVNSLLEFFRPLREWLEKENKRTGTHIGWGRSDKNFGYFKDSPSRGNLPSTTTVHLIFLLSTLCTFIK